MSRLLLLAALACTGAHAAEPADLTGQGVAARVRSVRLGDGWHEGRIGKDADGCRRFHPASGAPAVPLHAIRNLWQRSGARVTDRSLTFKIYDTLQARRREGWSPVSLGPLLADEPPQCRIDDGAG